MVKQSLWYSYDAFVTVLKYLDIHISKDVLQYMQRQYKETVTPHHVHDVEYGRAKYFVQFKRYFRYNSNDISEVKSNKQIATTML